MVELTRNYNASIQLSMSEIRETLWHLVKRNIICLLTLVPNHASAYPILATGPIEEVGAAQSGQPLRKRFFEYFQVYFITK